MTRDMLWGEDVSRNVILVDAKTCAESAQSIERGYGIAFQTEVNESLTHLIIGLYAHGVFLAGETGLRLHKEDRNLMPCNKEDYTEVDRTSTTAFELRCNLVEF